MMWTIQREYWKVLNISLGCYFHLKCGTGPAVWCSMGVWWARSPPAEPHHTMGIAAFPSSALGDRGVKYSRSLMETACTVSKHITKHFNETLTCWLLIGPFLLIIGYLSCWRMSFKLVSIASVKSRFAVAAQQHRLVEQIKKHIFLD